MWEEWRSKFTSALNEAVPLSVLKRSKKRKCPWMTPQLLHLLQKQKAMYQRVIRSGRRDTVAVQQHKAMRNQYNNLYRQNKNMYFQEHLAEYRYAPRPLWKAINHITGRQQQRLPPSVPLSELKSYFESLYSTPVSRQLAIPEGPPNNFSLTQFQPVTTRRVKDLLMKMNEKKAAGHDGICSKELKVVADKIAWQLATLFNESLETGEIPSDFKVGNIIPIFKSGKKDVTAPENYRGISLTPLVSKVLERIVFDEVSAFLSNRKLLSKFQFGFRASHSCSDLLLATLDDWLQARDKKQYTTAVFIDLSKAFDNVLHEHLLLTLQACGICGTALRWFRNFLYDRQQRVVVNNKSSSFFTCNKGVPQGSVLGPLLFNIYVADLPSLAREHGAKMPSFADDMTLYCSHTSAALACSSVSAALKDTSRALALRGLSINVSKTVAMVIAPHSRACQGLPTGVRLLLQNEEVKLVSQTRLLGIIIDDSLSWSPHVDSICKKVGRKIGALRRTYRQLTPTARRQFFVSVIQPDLEYAASATIPFMPTGQQDRLLALWKKAVRCLAGVHPQDDVLPLIRNLKLTLLLHRWSLQLYTTIRRCHQQSAPALLLEKLSFHEHQHSTRGRQQGDFRPFQPASLAGRISFTNRAPLLWNMLPREVQTSSSMLVFKKNILSLLDSPSSGKNLLQICFGNTTI